MQGAGAPGPGALPATPGPAPETTTAPGSGPRTDRGRRTRAKLVTAAHDVFSRATFPDVRVTDITGRAGVANGTFYTYFASKEEVFREIAVAVLHEQTVAPRRDPDNHEGDPVRDIAHASRAYFRACLRTAGVSRSVEQMAPRDPVVRRARRASLESGVARSERWIRRFQAQGICTTTIDPRSTAVALNTMNISIAYRFLVFADPAEAIEPLVRTVTHIWAAAVGLDDRGA